MEGIVQLLRLMGERGASDFHITTGAPPKLRIDKRLKPPDDVPLTEAEIKQLLYGILSESQKKRFKGELK